jgi:hypothetical protein
MLAVMPAVLLFAGEVGENPTLSRNRDRVNESRIACDF